MIMLLLLVYALGGVTGLLIILAIYTALGTSAFIHYVYLEQRIAKLVVELFGPDAAKHWHPLTVLEARLRMAKGKGFEIL